MFKLLSFIVTITILAFGLILGVLNPSLVKFDAFFAIYELPLSVLLAITLIFGGLVGVGLMLTRIISLRWQLKSQIKLNQKNTNQIIQLKKEITQFKVGQQSSTDITIK